MELAATVGLICSIVLLIVIYPPLDSVIISGLVDKFSNILLLTLN